MENNKEMVNHPSHYTAGGIEPIEYIKAKFTDDQYVGFLLGNVIKYVSRYRHKDGNQDIKKAHWYLTELLKFVEEQEGAEKEETDIESETKEPETWGKVFCDRSNLCPLCLRTEPCNQFLCFHPNFTPNHLI